MREGKDFFDQQKRNRISTQIIKPKGEGVVETFQKKTTQIIGVADGPIMNFDDVEEDEESSYMVKQGQNDDNMSQMTVPMGGGKFDDMTSQGSYMVKAPASGAKQFDDMSSQGSYMVKVGGKADDM